MHFEQNTIRCNFHNNIEGNESMMRITVRVEYYGLYRDITGIDNEFIEVPEHSYLRDFIRSLVDKHGDELGGLLFDEYGEPWDTLMTAVNSNRYR